MQTQRVLTDCPNDEKCVEWHHWDRISAIVFNSGRVVMFLLGERDPLKSSELFFTGRPQRCRHLPRPAPRSHARELLAAASLEA